MTDIEQLRPVRHCGTQPIQTERLLLRQFVRGDAADMFPNGHGIPRSSTASPIPRTDRCGNPRRS